MALGYYVGCMLGKKIAVIILLISSCLTYFIFFAKPSSKQQVAVNLIWHDKTLNCQSTFDPKKRGEAWFIEQLQFFISEIEVEVSGKGWQQLKLIDNPYQTAGTVLLGTNCRDQQAQVNSEKMGSWLIEFDNNIDISKVALMRFMLAVPFASNHLNPVSQESPLNVPSMFWVWQTGHKFLRAELASVNEQWIFHLGSTGCKASSVMRAPEQACRYPNTFKFEIAIAKGSGEALTLNLNLAELIKNVELTQTTSCQSERDNESCQQLFKNLSAYKEVPNSGEASRLFSITKADSITQGIGVE